MQELGRGEHAALGLEGFASVGWGGTGQDSDCCFCWERGWADGPVTTLLHIAEAYQTCHAVCATQQEVRHGGGGGACVRGACMECPCLLAPGQAWLLQRCLSHDWQASPSFLLSSSLSCCFSEMAPVCAVVGGVLGQEVVKVRNASLHSGRLGWAFQQSREAGSILCLLAPAPSGAFLG